MPPLQPKSRDDLSSSTLESLYSIEGFSDSEKIKGIRLAPRQLARVRKAGARGRPDEARRLRRSIYFKGYQQHSLNERSASHQVAQGCHLAPLI
ncbi:hypothetical protein [Rhizobium sp. PEPV16]|uniref:hypothetical protein n=1 Tax=Rhizobium sp. PEPV16 TaxID=1820614 RepID=UPI00124C4027|nr:hypothetical protein [Rhizobium sp. PEPV16]KAF5881490.1 hypothetical protein FY112_30150 [Rhizobium sp. PEPV16]